MKKLLAIIAICLAVLSTGCFEKKENTQQTTQQTQQKQTVKEEKESKVAVAPKSQTPNDPEAVEVESDNEDNEEGEVSGVVVEWDNDEDGKTNITNIPQKTTSNKTATANKTTTAKVNANYDYYYETVTIIDPNINTPLCTMQIPAGWSYKPNIIWNASGGNIVGGISALAPDGIESFWYQPISVGLAYVKADAEYNYQIAELKKRITSDFKVVESTTEPNQKIKDQINTLLSTYRNVQVPLAHNGSYTYRNAKITGKINGIDTVTHIEILSIRLPIPKAMYHAPVKLLDGRVIDTNIGEIVTCVKTVKAEHEHLLPNLEEKIAKLNIDQRWLSARDKFSQQLAQRANREIAQSRERMANIVSKHISDINNISREMQQSTSESMDRVREAWGYYRTGQSLVESSDGGGRETVDSTSNNIWKSSDGTIITSDSNVFDPNSGEGLTEELKSKEWTRMQVINPLGNQNGQ
ncbi:hypothetical protein IJJ97_04345 [bacterium]|nr:hypothetical protein [bacterium]